MAQPCVSTPVNQGDHTHNSRIQMDDLPVQKKKEKKKVAVAPEGRTNCLTVMQYH